MKIKDAKVYVTWRGGAVTMSAIAAVDVALWDIKGKALNAPIYILLGGRSRFGVMVYGQANGKDMEEAIDEVGKYIDMGYLAVRAQCGIPGLPSTYGVAKEKLFYEPARLDKSLEPYHLFWIEDAVTAEPQEGFRIIREHTTTPLAELYHVRTGCHGATDLSPVTMASALHFDISINNFGIQEFMRHTEKTYEVFPNSYSFKDGYMYPGDEPGHGVDFNEELAKKYPYERAYLPINRKLDGTMWNW